MYNSLMSAVNHDRYDDAYLRKILRDSKTIAMVGASANWNRPSYFAMKYLLDRGYKVIPVNPAAAGQEIMGQKVYGSLGELPVKADMVDIFRNSEAAGPITDEAIKHGAKVVWMQLGVRNEAAAQRAEAAGLKVVMNRCPKIEHSAGSPAPSNGTASPAASSAARSGRSSDGLIGRVRRLHRVLARYQAGDAGLEPARLHRHRRPQGRCHPVRLQDRNRDLGARRLSRFRPLHGRLLHQGRPIRDDRDALACVGGILPAAVLRSRRRRRSGELFAGCPTAIPESSASAARARPTSCPACSKPSTKPTGRRRSCWSINRDRSRSRYTCGSSSRTRNGMRSPGSASADCERMRAPAHLVMLFRTASWLAHERRSRSGRHRYFFMQTL